MTLRKELIDELLKASEGQDLFGKDGLLSELTGRLVERALEAELTEHIGYEKNSPAASQHPNSRNGHTGKTLRGKSGTVRVKVPVWPPGHLRAPARAQARAQPSGL